MRKEWGSKVKYLSIITLLITIPTFATDKLDLAIVTAAGLDVISTEYALRSSPYLSEGNPFGQTTRIRITGKTLATTTVIVVRHELKRRNHRKAAKVFGIIAVSVWGAAAVHNYRMTRQ